LEKGLALQAIEQFSFMLAGFGGFTSGFSEIFGSALDML